MLALVEWDGGGDGTSWFNPANWSTDTIPGPDDDVRISVPGSPVIVYSPPAPPNSINSLVCDEQLFITGTLPVTTTADINGQTRLRNGVIQGGMWDVSDGDLTCDNAQNRLIDVQVVGEIELGGGTLARLRIEGSTTFQLVRMTALEASSLGFTPGYVVQGTIRCEFGTGGIGMITPGQLTFAPAAVLDFQSYVTIGTSQAFGGAMTLVNQTQIPGAIDFYCQTLINQGQIIFGRSATFAQVYIHSAQLINQGLIESAFPNTYVEIENQWTNTGTIRATAGQIRLKGTVATANLGTLQAAGGNIALETIDNSNATLTLNQSTGSWNVDALFGGSVEFRDGGRLNFTRLIDVTMLSPIGAGLILQGNTRFPSALVSPDDFGLRLANNYVLRDPVTLAGGRLLVEQFAIASIAAGTVITGGGTIGAVAGPPTIINDGIIDVTDLTIDTPFNNRGVIRVSGGEVEIRKYGINEGVLDSTTSGRFELLVPVTHNQGGHFEGSGTIKFAGGTHNISGELATFTGAAEVSGFQAVVNLSQPVNFASLKVGGQVGGTVNFTVPQSVSYPVMLADYSVLGGGGDVTFHGVVTWTAGDMVGSGRTIIAPAGTLQMVGGPGGASGLVRTLSRVLRNQGIVNGSMNGPNPPVVWLQTGGRIENQVGGTFNFSNGRLLGTAGAGTNFENSGSLNLGPATTDLQFDMVPLINTGTLNLAGGTLRLLAGGSSTAGIDVPTGSNLVLYGQFNFTGPVALSGGGQIDLLGGSYNFAPGQFLAAGNLYVSGGSSSINDPVNLSRLQLATSAVLNLNAPATLTRLTMFESATLGGNADVTVASLLEWAAGTIQGTGRLIVPTGATATINPSNSVFLRRPFQNSGTVNFINGLIRLIPTPATAAITNLAGGSFNLTGGATLINESAPAPASFANFGTLRKSGLNSVFIDIRLENWNTVRVESGTLTLGSGGDQSAGGSMQVLAGATLTFGGQWSHQPGTSIVGAGNVSFGIGTHDVQLLDVTGAVSVANSSLVRMGTSARSGSLNLTASSRVELLSGGDKVWVTGSLGVTALSRIDVTNNAIIVDYPVGGPSPLGTPDNPASIFGMIRSGYAMGAWNGPGIISSAAAANPATALGFGEATSIFSTLPAIFMGQMVDDSAVLIRHTLGGDANLDATVNLADFDRVAANFGQSPRPFALGDFNYDGLVSLTDFNALAANFGRALAPAQSDDEVALALM